MRLGMFLRDEAVQTDAGVVGLYEIIGQSWTVFVTCPEGLSAGSTEQLLSALVSLSANLARDAKLVFLVYDDEESFRSICGVRLRDLLDQTNVFVFFRESIERSESFSSLFGVDRSVLDLALKYAEPRLGLSIVGPNCRVRLAVSQDPEVTLSADEINRVLAAFSVAEDDALATP